jgi:UDP-glucose 4-epimerase
MKILVTGGAGFIGSHIAVSLLEAGHQVVVVDNLHTGRRSNVPSAAAFYEADITDTERMDVILETEAIEAISHQAALANVRESMTKPLEYARANVLGTLALLELARKHNCRKFVFASTGGAVYGEGHSPDGDMLPFTEKSWPQPKDNYGANKLSAEYHLDLYYHAYGLEYVALRYPNVYGPRQDSKGEAGVVAIFAGAMLHDEPTVITGDGLQARDFTFVRDIARANLLALESGAVGIFNVGTGVPTNINTIHRILSDITGYSLTPEYAPRPVGEVLETYLDSTKAAELLHWQPTVSLKDGLQATVDWMRTVQPV